MEVRLDLARSNVSIFTYVFPGEIDCLVFQKSASVRVSVFLTFLLLTEN